jgi:nicotinamidase-related amidase
MAKYNRLDKDNAAALLVDHQTGLFSLVNDYSPSEFKNNVLASGTFDESCRYAAWDRMSSAGVQLVNWFAVACELHRDWRNDIEGLSNLLGNYIPSYKYLMTSYSAKN